MSQKKRKKRSPQGKNTSANPMELQQTSSTKRLDPAARNLLYLDLVFLAVAQLLVYQKVISNELANILTIVGAVIIVIALYFQFRPKDRGIKPPRR